MILVETFWKNMCLMAHISLHQNHMCTVLAPLPLWSSLPELPEVLFLGCSLHFAPNKTKFATFTWLIFFKSVYLPSFRCRDSQFWILSIINQIQFSLFLDYSNNYCCSLNSNCSKSPGFKVALTFVAPVVGWDPVTRSGLCICFFSVNF